LTRKWEIIRKDGVNSKQDKALGGAHYILYWMQAAQRVQYNPAFAYAVQRANQLQLPLLVLFVVLKGYPEANGRHYQFMFEGLPALADDLRPTGAVLVIGSDDAVRGVETLARLAAEVITDSAVLRHKRQWVAELKSALSIPLVTINSEYLFAPGSLTDKPPYNAAVVRKRIYQKINEGFINSEQDWLKSSGIVRQSFQQDWFARMGLAGLPAGKYRLVRNRAEAKAWLAALSEHLHIDNSVTPVPACRGGRQAAIDRINLFIHNQLAQYTGGRNDPAVDRQSGVSPYLHFGQISVAEILLQIAGALQMSGTTFLSRVSEPSHEPAGSPLQQSALEFFEQLVVRRELAANFCWWEPNYDSYICLPEWAKTSLREHEADKRPYLYTLEQLEQAETHDGAWNTAQTELLKTGRMHGYLRMYWGKQILQWTASPAEAFRIALGLNNKYALDGRDVNSYAGIAWCFGKHDRPWTTRPVYGMIRCMTLSGLQRKIDLRAYQDRIRLL